MARRILPTTVALTASAVLLLSACGGESAKNPDDIKGADKGASDSAKPSKDSSAGEAGRPEVKFPGSFDMKFEGWTSSDATEQAVLDDGRETARANHAALVAGEPEADYVAFYNKGAALDSVKIWVKGYADKDLTLKGSGTVTAPKVSLLGDKKKRAMLQYCMDERNGATENRKTGETQKPSAGDDTTLLYSMGMRKSAEGVWETAQIQTDRKGC